MGMSGFLVILLLSLCFAENDVRKLQPRFPQWQITNPVKVINRTPGVNLKYVGTATTTCSDFIVTLDDSPDCLKFYNQDGVLIRSNCNSDMLNGIDLYFYASAGYITTSDAKLIIIDAYSGRVIETFTANQTGLNEPFTIGLYSSFTIPTRTHNWVQVDKRLNSSLYYAGWSTGNENNPFLSNSYDPKVEMGYLGNTEPLICNVGVSGSYMHFVTKGANFTEVWLWSRNGINRRKGTVIGFGEIGACGADFNQRLWIWDKSDRKVKVFFHENSEIVSVDMIFEQELPELVNPIRILPTRNKVFIFDDNGVTRYDLPKMTVTVAPIYPSVTCSSVVRYNATIIGGSSPYTARVVPDFSSVSSVTPNILVHGVSVTLTANYYDLYDRPLTLYGESLALEFIPVSTTGIEVIDSHVVTHSGTNSWSMLMSSGYQYGFMANPDIGSTISAINFEMLELWIYAYPTVGRFKIDLTLNNAAPYSFVYNTSDIPVNTWHKLTFDLTASTIIPLLNKILFTDLSSTPSNDSYIFIDDIRLIPYPNTDRKITVFDYCGVVGQSEYVPFANTSAIFNVKLESPSVSCFSAGASGNKASDAVLEVVPTGGVRPYAISWTLATGPVNNVSRLINRGVTDNYMSVYDNSISVEVTDYSNTPARHSDPTEYYSPPYSLSFEPSGSIYNDLVYFIASGVSSSRFRAVEFYINGGAVGEQVIKVGLLSSQLTLAHEGYAHRIAGQAALRPKYWTKVTYSFPTTSNNYYGLVFSGIVGKPQARVYIDDIKFVSSSQKIDVRDSAGCSFSAGVYVLQPKIVAATSIVKNVKCFDSTDGVITLNVNGGSGVYNYEWLNSTDIVKRDYTLSGLSQGTFSVKVSDTNDCTTLPLVTEVSVLRPPAISHVYTSEHAQCAGSLGTIMVQVFGGVPPYYYRWTSPTSSFFDAKAVEAPYSMFSDSLQNSFTLSPSTFTSILCLGDTGESSHSGYCSLRVVPPTNNTGVVLFGIGCPNCFDFSLYTAVKFWVRVTRPSDMLQLSVSLIKGNETIYSQPLFDNPSASGEWLEAIITFPNSENIADYFRITNSGPNIVDFLVDALSLIPVGTFSKGLNVASGFVAIVEARGGDFVLSLSDSNGCPMRYNFTIDEPSPLSVTFSFQTPNETSGTVGGTVYAQASGGVGPYTYFWPELNINTQYADNLEAGSYSIVITDSKGCVFNSSALLPYSVRTTREYSPGVATGISVILAIGVILTFISLAILGTKWSHFTHYGPFYCVIINVGVLVSYIAVAVILPEPTDALCLLFPWFLGVAFTLVYGCLFIKTWVLYRVFRKASQMKKTNLTPFYILKVLSFFMAVEIIFMIIWSVVDPPKAAYANLVDNRREIQCTNDSVAFWVIFLVYKGAWIIFGAILAFLTRNITEEFNESKNIAYAIYNDIVLIAIGIILALSLAEVPSGVVIVEAAVVFLSFTFTMLILFFPIWWNIFFSSVDLTEMKLPSTKSTCSTGGGNSGGSPSGNSKSSYSTNQNTNTHSSRGEVYTL